MLDKRSPAQHGDPPKRLRRRRGARLAGSPLAATRPAPKVDVGRGVRTLREERGLSIRALAEKSGLAINTLSLIENGKTSPSVGTLQQVALALEVPITAFFETPWPKNNLVYVKANTRPRAAFAHGTLEDLGVGLVGRCVEPFVVTLEPNEGSGPSLIVHTGHEFVYCLEGRIAYTVEEHTYLLEPGDSLLFESRLPHRWQNVDARPARALLVLCPSDERDRPTEQHFEKIAYGEANVKRSSAASPVSSQRPRIAPQPDRLEDGARGGGAR